MKSILHYTTSILQLHSIVNNNFSLETNKTNRRSDLSVGQTKDQNKTKHFRWNLKRRRNSNVSEEQFAEWSRWRWRVYQGVSRQNGNVVLCGVPPFNILCGILNTKLYFMKRSSLKLLETKIISSRTEDELVKVLQEHKSRAEEPLMTSTQKGGRVIQWKWTQWTGDGWVAETIVEVKNELSKAKFPKFVRKFLDRPLYWINEANIKIFLFSLRGTNYQAVVRW